MGWEDPGGIYFSDISATVYPSLSQCIYLLGGMLGGIYLSIFLIVLLFIEPADPTPQLGNTRDIKAFLVGRRSEAE